MSTNKRYIGGNAHSIALRTGNNAVWTVTRMTRYNGKTAVEEINVVGYGELHKVLAYIFNSLYVPMYSNILDANIAFTAAVQVKYFGQVQ